MIYDLIELAEGNKFFTSGTVRITKLELAGHVCEGPDKAAIKPNVWRVDHMTLNCLLIFRIIDVIELEMP